MTRDNAPLFRSGISILLLVPPLVVPQIPPAWAVPLIVLGLGLVVYTVYTDWRSAVVSWRSWATQLAGLGACFLAIAWIHKQGDPAFVGYALLVVTGLVMLALVVSLFKSISSVDSEASLPNDGRWKTLREVAIEEGLLPKDWKPGEENAWAAPPRGGQLRDATLQATGVLHGGKLELVVRDDSNQVPFSDSRFEGLTVITDFYIAVTNAHFHETVDEVTASIVAYGDARHSLPPSFPVHVELKPITPNRSVNPRSRLMFTLGVLIEDKTKPPTTIRSFWLGGVSTVGIGLGFGEYLVRVACSGRNHSEATMDLQLTYSQTQVSYRPYDAQGT